MAARPTFASGSARSPSVPRKPASTGSASWTTSGRSATSARPSTRCSRPTPRSAGSPPRPSASSCSRWGPASSTASPGCSPKSEQAKLLEMVPAVVYREPGLLAKAVTTLDVLSGGRAILGIGAAWNGEESAGLGLFFPPLAERFERLEEAILICKQMWSGDEGPFDGKHYHLGRTLNSPQVLSRPHPPILIGGAGEENTLKLVARYADACNIAAYDLSVTAHKLDVLRQHCVNESRDYDEIEKTAQV